MSTSQFPFAVISRVPRDQRTISCQPGWTEKRSRCCWRLNEHLASSIEHHVCRESGDQRDSRMSPRGHHRKEEPLLHCAWRSWQQEVLQDVELQHPHQAEEPDSSLLSCPSQRSPVAQGVLSSPLSRPGRKNQASNTESGDDPQNHKALGSAHAEFQTSEEEKKSGKLSVHNCNIHYKTGILITVFFCFSACALQSILYKGNGFVSRQFWWDFFVPFPFATFAGQAGKQHKALGIRGLVCTYPHATGTDGGTQPHHNPTASLQGYLFFFEDSKSQNDS